LQDASLKKPCQNRIGNAWAALLLPVCVYLGGRRVAVGTDELQHGFFACRYGLKMLAGGAAALVHGVFPFLFETTGSRITRELGATLDKARAQSAARERESA